METYPLKIHVGALAPKGLYLELGPFRWRWLRLNEVLRVGASFNSIDAHIRKRKEKKEAPEVCVQRKRSCEDTEGSQMQAKERRLTRNQHCCFLDLEFPVSRTVRKSHVYCWSHRVCDILLWQHKLSNILSKYINDECKESDTELQICTKKCNFSKDCLLIFAGQYILPL